MVQMLIDDSVLNGTQTTTKPTASAAREENHELTRRRSLFQISGDMLALDDLLDETGGEIDETSISAIDAWFAELATDRDRKVDGYVSLLKECEARAKARKQRAAEIAELARLDERKAEYLKRRLFEFLQLHGIKRLDTDRSRLSICANGGKTPLRIDDNVNPAELPEEFKTVIVEVKPNAESIRAALESGKELPFARLMERGEHLRIK